MSTFQAIDDVALIRYICAAAKRIIYIAPGVHAPVANALGKRFSEVDQLDVTVVIDPDEDVCRIGYGDIAGLQMLHKLANEHHLALKSQPGLRIGVLIVDEQTLVWSPTPRSIEAPPDSMTEGGHRLIDESLPNGLVIGPDPAREIAYAVVAEGTNADPLHAEIGKHAVTPLQVKEAVDALTHNPPIPVDLARVTRVLSTKLQFVEFKIIGAKLSKQQLRISSDRLNADASHELKHLIQAQLKPFDDLRDIEIDVPAFSCGVAVMMGKIQQRVKVTERILEQQRTMLERRYLYPIAGFGQLIEKAQKKDFELQVEALTTQLEAHSSGLRKLLNEESASILDGAVDLIIARMQRSEENTNAPPLKPEDLRKEFQDGIDRVKEAAPKVSLVFKDVTHEQTDNEEFHKKVRQALPKVVSRRIGEWYKKVDAAEEVQKNRVSRA